MAVPWRGLLASAALHGALVLALIVEWPEEPELDSVPAPEAVVVSFASAAGIPDAAAEPETPPVEELDQIQPTEEIESLEPDQIPDQIQDAAPEETAAVEPEPEVLPEPEPPPPSPVAPPDVATLPPPEAVEAAEPKPPEVAPTKPAAAPATAAEQPVEKSTEANALPPEGAEPSPATTAPPSRDPDYPNILLAWLQQKLIYPPKAERRGIEGTATVWLSIDPTGRVLGYRILKSSGHRILDREVEALIERADPMPPVPAEEQASSLEFTIPVVFNIQ